MIEGDCLGVSNGSGQGVSGAVTRTNQRCPKDRWEFVTVARLDIEQWAFALMRRQRK